MYGRYCIDTATHNLIASTCLIYLQAAKKIADARLAKDFQSVVREFEKAQQLAAEKESAFAPFVPGEVLPSR